MLSQWRSDLRSRTDRTLIRRILDGEQRAETELVRRYQQQVQDAIRLRVGNQQTAEELAQDAFVKAFKALARFRLDMKFAPWLLRIARNVAIDHMRRKKIETVTLDGAPWWITGELKAKVAIQVPDPKASPPPTHTPTGKTARMLEAFFRLDPVYRECLHYRVIRELPYDQIAAILNIPASSARTYVHRAKEKLKEAAESA